MNASFFLKRFFSVVAVFGLFMSVHANAQTHERVEITMRATDTNTFKEIEPLRSNIKKWSEMTDEEKAAYRSRVSKQWTNKSKDKKLEVLKKRAVREAEAKQKRRAYQMARKLWWRSLPPEEKKARLAEIQEQFAVNK